MAAGCHLQQQLWPTPCAAGWGATLGSAPGDTGPSPCGMLTGLTGLLCAPRSPAGNPPCAASTAPCPQPPVGGHPGVSVRHRRGCWQPRQAMPRRPRPGSQRLRPACCQQGVCWLFTRKIAAVFKHAGVGPASPIPCVLQRTAQRPPGCPRASQPWGGQRALGLLQQGAGGAAGWRPDTASPLCRQGRDAEGAEGLCAQGAAHQGPPARSPGTRGPGVPPAAPPPSRGYGQSEPGWANGGPPKWGAQTPALWPCPVPTLGRGAQRAANSRATDGARKGWSLGLEPRAAQHLQGCTASPGLHSISRARRASCTRMSRDKAASCLWGRRVLGP